MGNAAALQIAGGAGLVAIGVATGQPWLVATGIGIGLGGVTAALTPTPAKTEAAEIGRTVRSATAFEQIVYGEARVGGSIVAIDRHTIQMSGTDPDYLDLVIVLCARPVEDFLGVYIGEDFVELQVHTGDKFYPAGMLVPAPGSKYRTFLGVEFYDGNQVAASQFMIDRRENQTSGFWTADHKLIGYAYAIVSLRWKQEIYPAGIPNVSFLLKGVAVYDPRTELTAYSDNAALCIADYMASGYGPPGTTYAELDTAALIAAANICDEEVEHELDGLEIPGLAEDATTVTEARYRISAQISAGDDWRQIAPKLAMCMAGGIFRVGAGWVILAGAASSAVMDLDESDMAGDLQVLPRRSRRELYNRIQVLCRNEHDRYQPFDAPPLEPIRYLTEDNLVVLINEIDMTTTVASPTQAVRIASIELEQNRQQIQVTGHFMWRAMSLKVGDVLRLSSGRMGWALKPFRVLRWELDPREGIRLELSEYCDAIYAFPATEDLLDCAPDTSFSAPVSDGQASALTVTRNDAGDSTIDWTAAAGAIDGYELRHIPVGEVAGDGWGFGNGSWIELELDPAPEWTVVELGEVETYDVSFDHTLVYRVEIRTDLGGGLYGDWVGVTSFPEAG